MIGFRVRPLTILPFSSSFDLDSDSIGCAGEFYGNVLVMFGKCIEV